MLGDKGIDNARLEADLLLAEVVGMERLELYTRFDMPIEDDARARFREFVRRRLKREPLAYILGRRDFLDWTFAVGPGALVPRPETEHLVEAAWEFLSEDTETSVVDLGVGSGCIPVSILLRRPKARGVGVDLSPEALVWAERNATKLGVADRLHLVEGDMLAFLQDARHRGAFDLLSCNPPYITHDERGDLAPEVSDHEPAGALFVDGADPLALHKRVVEAGRAVLKPGGTMLFELPGAGGDEMCEFVRRTHADAAVDVIKDLAGLDRVLRVVV